MTTVEEPLLDGLTEGQAAALLDARQAWAAPTTEPQRRRAPDGSMREVTAEAQVIPLDGARRLLAARSGGVPAAVMRRMAELGPKAWVEHCDALEEQTEREAVAAAAEQRRVNRYASYLRHRNPLYADASYDMLRPQQQHGGKVARWWSSPRRPRSLLLSGLSRTGKTTAAYAIANEAHRSGAWVEVFTEIHLAQELRGEQADLVWARVTGCDLLFLDDWGRARATDWWKEKLQELLDQRMAGSVRGQRLLVTANTPVDQGEAYAKLIDLYGDPIPERIFDRGAVLVFDGPRIRQMVEDW